MKLSLIEIGIGLVLFVYLLGAVMPGAITSVSCQSGYGAGLSASAVSSLYGLIPIFVIIAAVLIVYSHIKKNPGK